MHTLDKEIMGTKNLKRGLAGIALILFAFYLGWLGWSYPSLPVELFSAPRWLFYLLSFLLGAGAGLAFLSQDQPLAKYLAVVIWILFAIVGAWAAVFSPLEDLTGGLTMVSPAVNRSLARAIFGLGAILNLAVGIYGGWILFKNR